MTERLCVDVALRDALSSPRESIHDGPMHLALHHVLVVAAVAGSLILTLERGGRIFPIVALVASGIAALMAFGLMSLSLARYRVDLILPAIMFVAGALCWGRSTTRPTITAATTVVLASLILLLSALDVMA